MTDKRGLRSYNGHRLVLAGSGVLTRESRLGFDVDAEGLDGTRWTFRCAYRGRRLYLAYDEYGQVVGEFSRPLLLGRDSSLTWYGTEFALKSSSLLRKDWSLYDGGGTEVLTVHAHSMILYLAYDEYGQVVGEFSRPLLLGRDSSLTWYGTEFALKSSSLLRKDWSLYDGGGTEVLTVHAHSMIGKHKVSLQRTDAPAGAQHPNGLELYCAWLATRFSLERIRLAGA